MEIEYNVTIYLTFFLIDKNLEKVYNKKNIKSVFEGSVRVISGRYRGRNIETVHNNSIRPTTDRIKENLFNILMPYIQDSIFLDLFCGSGNIGIEAISRGAKKVYFNDMQKSSINILKKNLRYITEQYIVTQLDFKNFLYQCKLQFDIIYLDPPYQTQYAIDALTIISARAILKETGIVIIESDKRIETSIPLLECYDQRKYGNIYLTFYKRKKEEV